MMSADWIVGLGGGALIGLAAVLLFLFNGKIFGVSGIAGGLLSPAKNDMAWRVAVMLGFLVGGWFLFWLNPGLFTQPLNRSFWVVILAGFLVGFGSRYGNGCTSGHGVCGVGRLSRRSIAATITFTLSGIVTVWFVSQVLGIMS